MIKMSRETDIKYLKEANAAFGISNDYLEGKKEYEDMTIMEKADIDFINLLYGVEVDA